MLFKYLEEVREEKKWDKLDWLTVHSIIYSNTTEEAYERNFPEEDGEPTTADKYNKEWLDEQEKRDETKTKKQQS